MLNFYRQTEPYYQAKLKAAEYESKDSKFLIYYQNINDVSDDFNEEVQNLIREGYNIRKFNDFFE